MTISSKQQKQAGLNHSGWNLLMLPSPLVPLADDTNQHVKKNAKNRVMPKYLELSPRYPEFFVEQTVLVIDP